MRRHIYVIVPVVLVGLCGCQSLKAPFGNSLAADAPDSGTTTELRDDRSTATAVADYITGRDSEDRTKARKLYQEGEAEFRQAATAEGNARRKLFRNAAGRFRKAAKEWPQSALQEDALLMAGESYFFADDLPRADAVFGEVLEDYPRSRHVDRIVSRRFEIAKYWVEADKHRSFVVPVNFTDRSLPAFDIDGTGIELLDQIRYDDPTGKLADDATMAAGIEHFQREKWIIADGMFTDLMETFPDSDHQFNAHLFALKCKLEIYQGPKYSGAVLEEGEKIIKRMKRRYQRDLKDPSNREMVAKVAAQIEFHQAERLWHNAEFRSRRSEYGAARFYYQKILEDYPNTAFAQSCRDQLASIESEPDLPPKRLAWLTDLFPDSEQAKPLLVGSSESILR